MVSRAPVFILIAIAVVIIGIVGTDSLPSDIKLESILPSDIKLESILPSEEKLESDLPSEEKLETEEFPRGTVKLDDVLLEVQIADTKSLRNRGLMYQDQLPFDEGMFFVFDSTYKRSIWMKDMKFSVDVIWIDADGKVVYIEENAPPCKPPPNKCPYYKGEKKAAKYILEVTAGFVDKHNISTKSKLEIIQI